MWIQFKIYQPILPNLYTYFAVLLWAGCTEGGSGARKRSKVWAWPDAGRWSSEWSQRGLCEIGGRRWGWTEEGIADWRLFA